MAKELPYLASYKNVEKMFKAIDAAKRPESITTRILADTFGLKSVGDRQLIPMLRTLGFLDQSNKPTADYDLLKNPAQAPFAIAGGVRRAYAPLFEANENAHTLSGEALRGLISQVAGADKGIASKIAGTFSAFAKLGNFAVRPADSEGEDEDEEEDGKEEEEEVTEKRKKGKGGAGLRPEFHYNIQIHLPDNGTESTYLNIFNAIRKTFK